MTQCKACSVLILSFLGVAAAGCSPAFLRELSPPRKDRSVSESPLPMNLSLAAKQLAILKERTQSHGGQPLEKEAVSALDYLIHQMRTQGFPEPSLADELRRIGVGLLGDPSEEIRFRAADLLAMTATDSEEPVLLKASETDPSPVVREMALEALELRGLGAEVWEE